VRFRLTSAVVILAVSGFAFFFFPSLAKLAVTVVISSFCLPGVLLVWLVWNRMLGQPTDLMNPAYGMWTAGAALAFAVGFSYIFWSILFSRLLKFVGWWDPFGRPSGRPWILRGMIRVRDWWEILTRFGRQATGGWAGLLEVLSNRFRTGDVFLGRPRFKIGGGMLRPIGIATEKHMVTIAGTGAGKSTGALIPNLCLHRGSLLCVDPKGELARITARRRGTGGGGVQGMGQDVHVLDPFRITGIESASYNVFDEMALIAERDIDAPVSYAGKVAEALVEISGRDPYWDISARRLLMGLILYVFQGPAGKRNLIQVRRLLMEGDKEGFEAGVREGYIDPKKNDAFDALLILMKHAREGPYRDTIAFAAGSLTQMGPNQLGSVLSTAQEHTAFLDLPEIRKVILTSDFLLEDLKNRPVSVYLSVPINMVSGIAGRWLRMFILLLIDMMMRVSEAPKPPILLAIDEFPSLGKLDGIEVVAPVMRSYGVRFWAVGQDIEQFRKVYPDSWGGFIGGAEAVQFMGVKHIDTVKMVVEFLGRHVIRKREGEGKLRRTVAEERNLLDANQVSQILYKERKNQIVWRGDRRPLILKVTPYFEYMPWWYYSRDARYAEKWSRRLWRWGKAKPDRLPTFDAPSSWPSLPAAPPARPPEKSPQLLAPGNGDWADKILAKPPSNLMNL
jgi:type IV secretion system protein VirD4